MFRSLACLILVFAVSPAMACINDAELPHHEREFRSQYRGQVAPTPAPAHEPSDRPNVGLLYGAGGLFLIGAIALTFTGRRAAA